MLPETFLAWCLKSGGFFHKVAGVLMDNKRVRLFPDTKPADVLLRSTISYFARYGKRPSFEVLRNEATTADGVDYRDVWDFIDLVERTEIDEKDLEWAIDTAEKFLRNTLTVNAIERAYDFLASGGPVESIIGELEKAVGVRLDASHGHDFAEDWRVRLEYYLSEDARTPFFLDFLNDITNGGFKRPSLNVITTRTGGGKTMFMVNQAFHCLMNGMNVLYFTFEDGELSVGERLDALATRLPLGSFSGKSIKEEVYVKRIKRWLSDIGSSGKLKIKEMPSGSPTVVHLKSFISDLKAKEEFVPDVVFVDYLNLMLPARAGSYENSYSRVGAVAVELRGFAASLGVPVWTATQLNREGARSDDPTTEDVSESMVVSHTSDFMLSLISDENLRKEKQAVLKILKSRYGGEQTKKVITVDPDSGRISPYGEDVSGHPEEVLSMPVVEDDDDGDDVEKKVEKKGKMVSRSAIQDIINKLK